MPQPDLLPVFNALPGANLLLSPEWRIVGASDDYLAATLTERATIVGQFIFDAFPDNPEAPEANAVANVRASLAQVMATRQLHEMAPQHYDVPDPAQPGRFVERHWQPRHTPVLDAQGQVQFIIQSVQDITARHLAQRQLRDSQDSEQDARADAAQQRQRFYEVLMALPAPVATYHGPDHVYHFVNAAYRRYFPAQALPGRSLREVLPETEAQGVLALMDRVYQTGEPSYQQELEVNLDFDGRGQPRRLFLNWLLHPLRDPQGHVDGLLDFSYDVTEQVLARRQVQQFNHELEARVQARTAQLSQQQGLLQQILGQVPAALATLTGPEHRYTFFNDRYRALSTDRLQLGRSVAEAHPEVVAQGVISLLDHVYATGQAFVATERAVQLRDDATDQLEQRYLDYIYQPMSDAQGHTTGILVFVLDVTEKVQTLQHTAALQTDVLATAQRQAQERATLYQMFEQTPAAICIQRGPAHRYEYVNPAYQALFPDRRLVGQPVAEALPETVEQGFVALLDGVYQTGETFFGRELPVALAATASHPARTIYFNFSYQAYRENGKIVGISTFAYDVTAQVAARRQNETLQAQVLAAARRQAQERETFFKVFEQTPALIQLLRAPGHRIEYVNPAYQQVFPGRPLVGLDLAEALPELTFQLVNPSYQRIFPGRELLGKPLFQALPELVGTLIPGLLEQVYRTGEPYVAQELPLMMARYEGAPLEEIHWTFNYLARRNAHGAIDGVLVFAYDVTDQVQARRVVEEGGAQSRALAAELALSNQQLTRTNVDLDNFIYTASHDLKAPISNIEGLLLALEHELPAASRAGDVPVMLDLMQGAVERFKRTISHLTDVSRLQKEHAQPHDQVPLSPLITEVQLDLAPLVAETQARIQVEVAACPDVTFSEKNLRSVVFNLLSNALKYRHPDRVPEVQVRCRLQDNYSVLEVEDNGLGLDLSRGQAQLFAMFQRLHTHVEGTGIGLYMVKKMVENAGGRIEVQSQLGQGTTFTVYFPR